MNALTAVLAGSGVGLGLWLMLAGWRGVRLLPSMSHVFPSVDRIEVAFIWLAAAALGGVVAYLTTGWLVAGLLTVGFIAWLPRAIAMRATQGVELAKIEAIASWAEMIRDNIAGSAGLEQSLIASAAVSPRAIAPELRRFSNRLDRMPTVDALTRLGAELDHPSADLVVVALANAAQMEARELGPLLGRLAETIRGDVRMRLRVEVGRARIRTSAQIVVATTVVTIAFLFVFSRQLLEAYDSTIGQLWLVLVAGVFALGGWLLHSFGHLDMPERFSARANGNRT